MQKKGKAIYLFNKPIRFNAVQSIITESFSATWERERRSPAVMTQKEQRKHCFRRG